MLVLLGPPVCTQVTRDLGWSRDAAHNWIAGALLERVFGIRRTRE